MGTRRQLRDIDLIVIHCSATPNGRWTTVGDIDAWHNARGVTRTMSLAPDHEPTLKHIGYHFVIYTTGAVCCGRPLIESGAHTAGHNGNSVGVCMVGTDRYSREQWHSLRLHIRSLVRYLRGVEIQARAAVTDEVVEMLRRAKIRICGHRDLSPDRDGDGKIDQSEWLKTCPGFDVAGWLSGGMRPGEIIL